MSKKVISFWAAILASASSAIGADTVRQARVQACNAEAHDLKSPERESFVRRCLKAGEERNELSQRELKMQECESTARERQLEGDKRRNLVSRCIGADHGERPAAAGGRGPRK